MNGGLKNICQGWFEGGGRGEGEGEGREGCKGKALWFKKIRVILFFHHALIKVIPHIKLSEITRIYYRHFLWEPLGEGKVPCMPACVFVRIN